MTKTLRQLPIQKLKLQAKDKMPKTTKIEKEKKKKRKAQIKSSS